MAKKVEQHDGHKEDVAQEDKKDAQPEAPICGVIRPIAPTDGYPATHWAEVGDIISESIRSAGFHPRLVSDADNVAVIHGTIVQNIFDDQVIVCDVSSRNPNVMFELGMRLAFDKPVVIVKDDATTYSFDTGLIEHINYPKSLHYHEIRAFKDKLAGKIMGTAEKSRDPEFSPFLKHFRHISPKKLQNEDVSFEQFIVKKLDQMDARMTRMLRSDPASVADPISSLKSMSGSAFSVPAGSLAGADRIVRDIAPNAKISYRGGALIVEDVGGPATNAKLRHAMSLYLAGASPKEAISDFKKDFILYNGMISDDGVVTETHKIPE